MAKKYVGELTDEARKQLFALLTKGKGAARNLCRSQLFLQADEGASEAVIAATLHLGVATVERTRKRFIEEGLEAALTERRGPGGQPKLQGKDEALLIAPACSVAPNGRKRWTLQWLAERLGEVGLIESVSDDTVGRTLKKTRPSQG